MNMHTVNFCLCTIVSCQHACAATRGGIALECCAGQAIVQMAYSTTSRMEYAVKFFVARSAFEQEKELYCGQNPLGQFLPQVPCPRLTASSKALVLFRQFWY